MAKMTGITLSYKESLKVMALEDEREENHCVAVKSCESNCTSAVKSQKSAVSKMVDDNCDVDQITQIAAQWSPLSSNG